jgi:hypothetical protein
VTDTRHTAVARLKMLSLLLAAGMVLAVSSAELAAGAEAAQGPMPAVWAHHALVVELRNLPKPYTCDELWYKFKDVLLAIGAASEMKILPSECGREVGPLAYSPRVQLEFSTPAPAGAVSSWATLQAVRRPVLLEPGKLPHLDAQDCELLNQMRSTLLNYLDVSVTTFRLPCQAPMSSVSPYRVTVQALVLARESPPAVARVP